MTFFFLFAILMCLFFIFIEESFINSSFRSSFFLFSAAAIWGFAFVAQRVGMDFMGPFYFDGIRFLMGAISLIPLLLFRWHKNRKLKVSVYSKSFFVPGIIAGCILFMAATLQQVGLVSTSAGKSAFITGLYIVLVPFLGLFLKQRIHRFAAIGAVLAVIGLYFLCINGSFSLSVGDVILFIGAFFWAGHILAIDRFASTCDPIALAVTQFLVCSILSFAIAIFIEPISLNTLKLSLIPLLYSGVASVGIAYTCQILGQKGTPPARAAIIMSMESVFAVLGGALLIGENLGVRGFVGCLFMLVGMIFAQLKGSHNDSNKVKEKL